MATYTEPTTRSSGFLVTANVWNTDIVENIKYFKDAPVVATALIVGAATTSGIRLDLESGTLAVREGDDSAYGPINTGALTVASGRALIGTATARTLTSLDSLAQVETAGSTNQQLSLVANRADTGGASLILGKSRGTTVNSNTIVQDGDNLGFIRWNGADGADMDSIAAQILAQVDGAAASNDVPGRLIFSTSTGGTLTERMRITSTGVIMPAYTTAVTGTYTVNATNGSDQVIMANGTFTVNLYAASTRSGYRVTVKNTGTGTITLDGNASETIDGETTKTISVQYASLTLFCDGSNWHII